MGFVDRADAGRRLTERLGGFAGEQAIVLGLPRGGVPVAFEVAAALGAPLDVIVVRKLGVPFQPELAMGALGEDGVRVVDDAMVRAARVTPDELAAVESRERDELERRALRFRRSRPRLDLDGRTALVVDDGIATGSTARAACLVARAHGAAKVVLAVPVAPRDVGSRFSDVVDELVVLETPEPFIAVGRWYDDFSATSDDEVVALLDRAAAPEGSPSPVADDPPGRDDDVAIAAGAVTLGGHLQVPGGAVGCVVFAHGSGSSRHSSRNRYVARVLADAGMATLLFDLLTVEEELDRANVFDVELLAARLVAVTDWVRRQPGVQGLPVGYFGASTGAAAALWAAAGPGPEIAAVVSRGGRPDLAGPRLASVAAPTRLVVGGDDTVVLELNREAEQQLRCEHDLVVVPGATHLFEEPGTLAEAAGHARDWFLGHFTGHPPAAPTP
jgi:putative phosphoribosyl transferase